MTTASRPQQRYDHRLRDIVQRTGDLTIATDLGSRARRRESVRGPRFWQMDVAASKRVRLGVATAIELRVEAFNLLNRTNFRAPQGNRSDPAFGTITAAYDPRQMQLGVKVIW